MIIADTTITITALLDELTEALSYLPGKYPQDGQIASTLLALVMAEIQGHGTPSRLLMSTLERRGVDACEAEAVAQALHGLALRLGAWLGRDRKAIGAMGYTWDEVSWSWAPDAQGNRNDRP